MSEERDQYDNSERLVQIREANLRLIETRLQAVLTKSQDAKELSLPTFTIAADDPGAMEMMVAYADYLVTYGTSANTPAKLKTVNQIKQRMQDWLDRDGLREIVVCASCSRACCLAYVQECESKKGMVVKRVSDLRKKRLEHPSWLR